MPAATRIGDIGSGHGCHYPPTPAIEASEDMFVNALGARAARRCLCPARMPCLPCTGTWAQPVRRIGNGVYQWQTRRPH